MYLKLSLMNDEDILKILFIIIDTTSAVFQLFLH